MDQAQRKPWWDKSFKGEGLVGAINARVTNIRMAQEKDALRDLINEAVYEGRRETGAGRLSMLSSVSYDRSAPARINLIKAKVQAVASRLAQHRPFPVITCEDATWSQKRFARQKSAVLRTRLGQTDIERARLENRFDTLIRGTGVLKVVRTIDGDVTAERVPRAEVMVPQGANRHRTPRTLYHLQSWPLEMAIATYGNTAAKKDAMMRAAQKPSVDADGFALWGMEWADDDTRQVLISGAWHLPSGELDPKTTDGRHAEVIYGSTEKGAVLLDEPWLRRRHVFPLLHWNPPRRGLLGAVGLVEDLLGIQAKATHVHHDIQNALYHGSQLRIFVARASNVRSNHLRRQMDPAEILYDGAPPQYIAPQAVHPQLFSYLDWLINMADDVSGLSRDYQSGKTSLGKNASGKALDTMDDIQSDRYRLFQLLESLQAVDLGTIMLDEARSMYEDKDLRRNCAPWIKDHAWDDIVVDGGDYHLAIEPINFLAGTRGSKIEAVQALAGAGLIKDQDDVLAMFEEPDMARMNRRVLGVKRAVESLLERLGDPDIDLYSLAPDSFFPIGKAMTAVQAELQDAWANEAPEAILDRYRTYLQMAKSKQDEIEAEQAAAALRNSAAAGGGGPPGPSGMPPGGGPNPSMMAPPPGPGMAPGGGAVPELPPGAAAPPMATPLG